MQPGFSPGSAGSARPWLMGLTAAIFIVLGLIASRPPAVRAGRDATPHDQVWRLQLVGDFPQAVRVARENYAQVESQFGSESEQVTRALDLLASALTAGPREFWAEAGTTARRALARRESLYGAGDIRMVGGISRLVMLLYRNREWEEAGRHLRRATRIIESTPERPGPDYASALMALGETFRQGSNYGASSRYYRRAVVGMEREHGRLDHRYAQALKNFGRVQEELGDYAAALKNAEQALAIFEETQPPESEAIASSMNQIGNLHRRLGHADVALTHYQRAEEIWRKLLGDNHPSVARSLNNQALLRADVGDFDGAMILFRRGKDLRESALGPRHLDVAGSLIHIGNLLWKMGDFEEATGAIEAGIEILIVAVGEKHPDLADALTSLAGIRKAAGDDEGAVTASIRAEAASRGFFRYSSEGLGEWEIVRYAELRPSALQTALAVLSEKARREAVTRVSGPQVDAIWEAVIGSRALAFATTRAHRKAENAAAAERAFPDRESGGSLDAILDHLEPGDALLAFVRSSNRAPSSSATDPSFVAFVGRKGGQDALAIPLGSAVEIERRVTRWQESVSADPRARDPEASLAEYIRAGAALKEAIWDPVAGAIGDARRLFIVPDGVVGLVSFATLPTGAGRCLVDDGPLLHYLTAEWGLLETPYRPGKPPGLLLVAAPDYDQDREEESAVPGARSGVSPECDLVAPRLSPLPGAVEEVAMIQDLMFPLVKTETLAGNAASEVAFRREAPRWRAIHIATHGLVLEDPCPAARGATPTLVSALAFSGASGRRAPMINDNSEDGLLTTDEIASLNLEGVEWAVLSGCRTGVGQIHPDEGILHLGRAFHLAGVHTVIDSLWEVEDGATRAWMEKLYAEKISGRSTIEAVQRADLAILGRLRARHQAPHPFFWGAFVAIGDWR